VAEPRNLHTMSLSVSEPGRPLSRRVNLCCVFPNPDGDAKRIRGGLSWFGQRRPYVQRGRKGIDFLAPKCLRRGYKLREREPVPSLKERVQWSIAWDVDLSSEVVSCGFRPLSFLYSLGGSLPPLL
jgi:hypothetical protein